MGIFINHSNSQNWCCLLTSAGEVSHARERETDRKLLIAPSTSSPRPIIAVEIAYQNGPLFEVSRQMSWMFSVKIAASFKVPSLVKRSKLGASFPKFDWRDIAIQDELGRGTFGSVFRANFAKESANVVIKCWKEILRKPNTLFEKEAGILSRVKGHRNIAEFLRFCEDPYSIMMEYACFAGNCCFVFQRAASVFLLANRTLNRN